MNEPPDVRGLLGKAYDEFALEDPFNGHLVEGFIGRTEGDAYGALIITRVNGHETSAQLILATPKVAYPFDHAGTWHFPAAQKILAYEKLDGTNVFGYVYRDHREESFITWKPRLRPFLANGRWGPFLDLWREMLKTYPDLPLAVQGGGASFELYGSRNLHLIQYEAPLDIALLFVRRGDGGILPPESAGWVPVTVPRAALHGTVTKDYVGSYQEQQALLSRGLRRHDDGTFSGAEGLVWYLLDEGGRWHLFKLKPEEIEAIHWAEGRHISRESIKTTALNLLESSDELSVDGVKELLLEEFSAEEVGGADELIIRVVRDVAEELEFKEGVMLLYKELAVPYSEGTKAQILRSLSRHFPGREMKRVYAVLSREVGQSPP